MSAHRTITLTCDKPECRERYLGGEGRDVRKVRAEAAKLAGWSRRQSELSFSWVDLCRWHA